MEITKRLDFDGDPAQINAMMLDEKFHRLVGERQEAKSQDIQVSDRRVRAGRVFTAHDSIIAFVGKTLEIVEDTEWVSSTHADMSIAISAAPVHYVGTLDLQSSGTGTTATFAGNLTVKIPLLGPSLEKQAAKVIDLALTAFHAAGIDYLAAQQ